MASIFRHRKEDKRRYPLWSWDSTNIPHHFRITTARAETKTTWTGPFRLHIFGVQLN